MEANTNYDSVVWFFFGKEGKDFEQFCKKKLYAGTEISFWLVCWTESDREGARQYFWPIPYNSS